MSNDSTVQRMLVILALATLLALSSSAALAASKGDVKPARKPSGKLNVHTFFEEGRQLFIGVDTRMAGTMKKGGIVPLGLAVANLSKIPVTLNRESFVLEAPDGTRFPLISLKEFRREYNRSRIDVQLADSLSGMMTSRFETQRFTPFQLFPAQGGRRNATNAVDLGRRFWTQNYLYFRVPETLRGTGVFTLLVDTGEESPSVVNFKL
jgi:hypothetical protein